MTPPSYLSVILFLTGAPKRIRCITTTYFHGFFLLPIQTILLSTLFTMFALWGCRIQREKSEWVDSLFIKL